MGEKDHTEGLIKKNNILKVLLDMHEGVPLEDPGPNIASKDKEEGVAGAKVGTRVLELPGVGGQHEDVPLGDTGFHDDVSHGDEEHLGDYDGQGSPRPSQ